MTRNQKLVNSTYPELAAQLQAQDCTDFIIDGEVVAFAGAETSFSLLQQRLGVRHPSEALRADVPVFYYVFDVLWADGRDLRQLPLDERKHVLRRAAVLRRPDPVHDAPQARRRGIFRRGMRQWLGGPGRQAR